MNWECGGSHDRKNPLNPGHGRSLDRKKYKDLVRDVALAMTEKQKTLNPVHGRSHDRKIPSIRDMAVGLSWNKAEISIPRFLPEHLEGGRSLALKKFEPKPVPTRLRDCNPGFRREFITCIVPGGVVDDPLFTDENSDPVV